MIGQLSMSLKGAAKVAYLRKTLPADFRRQLHVDVFRATTVMRNDIVQHGFGGHVVRAGMFMESSPGNQLASRESGGARSRITHDVIVRGNVVFGIAGTPDRYILANELGAVIHPRSGKMLVIPTVNMLTPTGRLKEEWAAKLAGGGWRSLDWKRERLFILKAKRRGTTGAWIARKVGGGAPARGAHGRMKSTAKIELLAYLTPEVNIPARHMMLTSLRRVSPEVTKILGKGIQIVLMKAA